jgi:predicted NBD/HSP70 family sugar kinase
VDDFVYVMVSDGVGAGLVLDGRLYEGAVAAAAHESARLDRDVAGARALSAALTLTHGRDNTLAAILASDHDGDERAQRVMDDAGSAVGRAVIPLCTVLDLGLVVIGGDCAISATFVDAVRRTVGASTTPLRRQPVPVVAGALGERAEMLGAVALATQRTTLT